MESDEPSPTLPCPWVAPVPRQVLVPRSLIGRAVAGLERPRTGSAAAQLTADAGLQSGPAANPLSPTREVVAPHGVILAAPASTPPLRRPGIGYRASRMTCCSCACTPYSSCTTLRQPSDRCGKLHHILAAPKQGRAAGCWLLALADAVDGGPSGMAPSPHAPLPLLLFSVPPWHPDRPVRRCAPPQTSPPPLVLCYPPALPPPPSPPRLATSTPKI